MYSTHDMPSRCTSLNAFFSLASSSQVSAHKSPEVQARQVHGVKSWCLVVAWFGACTIPGSLLGTKASSFGRTVGATMDL